MRELAGDEIEAHGHRLQGEPREQHALGADPVGHEPAEDLAAQRGQTRRAEHGRRGHRPHAVVDRVGDHVENGTCVRRATREIREGEDGELRRAQRLGDRELTAAGHRRGSV